MHNDCDSKFSRIVATLSESRAIGGLKRQPRLSHGNKELAVSSALARLVGGLKREQHDYRASLEVFPALNVAKLAADLAVAKIGAQRGAEAEPSSDSAVLDDVESRVVERVEAEKNSAHGVLLDELHLYKERLSGLDFEGRFATIRQAAPAAVSEFRAEAAQGRDELHSLRRHLRDVEAERDDFRRRHRLTRAARWATGGNLTLKVGVLLSLFVFEVFLNGFFLAKGSELGYVGGAAEALIFALLNIGVSFLAGAVGVRELNHRNFMRKLLGLAALMGYLAIAVGLNLTLAHYREAAGSFVSDAGHEVLVRLQTDPLGIMDIKSWLFFGIGMLCSLIAFGDSYLIFDPYPGYGTLEKRRAAAYEAYIAEVMNGETPNQTYPEDVVNNAVYGPQGFGDWNVQAYESGHSQIVQSNPAAEQGWGVGPARRWAHYPKVESPNPSRNFGEHFRNGQLPWVSNESKLYVRTQLAREEHWSPFKQRSPVAPVVPVAPSVPYVQTVPTFSGGPVEYPGIDVPLGVWPDG